MIIFAIIAIITNTIFASWWVLHGNIVFHTDIARDFLLIEDIVVNRNLALLGPRSGAIPGVFHGPMWLYLNLPAFILGNGNPVVVGWFWILLSLITAFIVFWVGSKLFDKRVGLISAILITSIQAKDIKYLFNPYGALLLSPLYFYFLHNYLKYKQVKYLITSILILGFIIQFQMAFGVPVLIITSILVILTIIKCKKYAHLLSFLTLLIPLSSYIIFDIRHNFLQTRSVYEYVFGNQTHGKLEIDFSTLLTMRTKEMIVSGIGMLSNGEIVINTLIILIFIFAGYKLYKNKKFHIHNPLLLFLTIYIGFWTIALAFKGPMWSYYYWPLLPLLVIIFSSLVRYINKYLFALLFILLLAINTNINLKELHTYNPDYKTHGESSWVFNYQMAKDIYLNTKEDFGYFIFTPDLYGYYPRYAMNYVGRNINSIKAYPFVKKNITYLLIAPPPFYGKDPGSIWYQKNINSTSWKISDVRISKTPIQTTTYENGFVVEKYELTEDEINIAPNPYLINNLIFR